MLERFYPAHVLWRLSISEQEFWESKALTMNDWPGLAALLYSDVFSLDFLTPLSDNDTSFRLEVCSFFFFAIFTFFYILHVLI